VHRDPDYRDQIYKTMKNKLTKLISVILILSLAWQGASYAQPELTYSLRVVAFDEREIARALPGSRQEGEDKAKERLLQLDVRKSDFYFNLADLDRFNTFNIVYSKVLMGTLGQPSDVDLIYLAQNHSLFREVLTVFARICRAHGIDPYRYLAGDEVTPQFDSGSVYTAEEKLNLIRRELNKHFSDRYAVARIDAPTEAAPGEQAALEAIAQKEDVLSISRYGLSYYIVVARDNSRTLGSQFKEIGEGLADEYKPGPYVYKPEVVHKRSMIPALSMSLGAISTRAIIEKLQEQINAEGDGESIVYESGPKIGHIKEKYIDLIYQVGMNVADDMLGFAKVHRDTVYAGDVIDDRILHRQIQSEINMAVNEQQAMLRALDDQRRFRAAVGSKDNLILIEVDSYNGELTREDGGFHAVNNALGHDNADKVIAVLYETIREVFAEEGLSADNMCRLSPPDQFAIALSEDIDKDLLARVLGKIRARVQNRLKAIDAELSVGADAEKFGFNVRLKLSAVPAEEVGKSTITVFKDRLRTMEAVSKLEKAVEMVSALSPQQATTQINIDDAVVRAEIDGGEVRIFSTRENNSGQKMEDVLQVSYRYAQERMRQEAIEDQLIREIANKIYRDRNLGRIDRLIGSTGSYKMHLAHPAPAGMHRNRAVIRLQGELPGEIKSLMQSLGYPADGYYPTDEKAEQVFITKLHHEMISVRSRFRNYRPPPRRRRSMRRRFDAPHRRLRGPSEQLLEVSRAATALQEVLTSI